jgi:hypothetical protein
MAWRGVFALGLETGFGCDQRPIVFTAAVVVKRVRTEGKGLHSAGESARRRDVWDRFCSLGSLDVAEAFPALPIEALFPTGPSQSKAHPSQRFASEMHWRRLSRM